MSSGQNRFHGWRAALCLAGAATLAGLTGCQVDVGGQTLPSPYYLDDDIQYFPAGPEFKLPNEAAALKADAEQQRLETRQSAVPTKVTSGGRPAMGPS